MLREGSQRAVIIRFERGVPYFKVRQGPRAAGSLLPSARTWKRGERARAHEEGISLTLVSMAEMWARVWMSVPQGKWRALSQFLGKVQARGPPEGVL